MLAAATICFDHRDRGLQIMVRVKVAARILVTATDVATGLFLMQQGCGIRDRMLCAAVAFDAHRLDAVMPVRTDTLNEADRRTNAKGVRQQHRQCGYETKHVDSATSLHHSFGILRLDDEKFYAETTIC